MFPAQLTRTKQSGAALVVGLVLLLVLTLLAVSTMRTASQELLLAGNTQYRENAFRLAESAVADGLNQGAAPNTLTVLDGWVLDLGTTQVAQLDGEYDLSIRFLGTSPNFPVPGFGFSSTNVFHHFQVDGTGRTDQRGARADVSQGVFIVRPAFE